MTNKMKSTELTLIILMLVMFTAIVIMSILCRASTASGEASQRPVHTFSIVARDSVSGEIGVAVQSHWFSVGSVVSWAEAGVGAVATQSRNA